MQDLVDLRSVRTDEEELVELAPGETSLHFFQKIYRSVRQPMARRMKAVEYALQREHPKLGAVATMSLNGNDFAVLLDRAIARSGNGAKVKQIDLTPEPVRRRQVTSR